MKSLIFEENFVTAPTDHRGYLKTWGFKQELNKKIKIIIKKIKVFMEHGYKLNKNVMIDHPYWGSYNFMYKKYFYIACIGCAHEMSLNIKITCELIGG